MPDKTSSSSGSGSGAGDYTYKSSGTNSQVRPVPPLSLSLTAQYHELTFSGIISHCYRATTIALVTTAPAQQTRTRTTIRIREFYTYWPALPASGVPAASGVSTCTRRTRQRRYILIYDMTGTDHTTTATRTAAPTTTTAAARPRTLLPVERNEYSTAIDSGRLELGLMSR
jgi:hypothetical protein